MCSCRISGRRGRDGRDGHGRQVAYEAYREAYEDGLLEVSSERMPPFEELPARVRVAFEAAAQAVCRRYGAIY